MQKRREPQLTSINSLHRRWTTRYKYQRAQTEYRRVIESHPNYNRTIGPTGPGGQEDSGGDTKG